MKTATSRTMKRRLNLEQVSFDVEVSTVGLGLSLRFSALTSRLLVMKVIPLLSVADGSVLPRLTGPGLGRFDSSRQVVQFPGAEVQRVALVHTALF